MRPELLRPELRLTPQQLRQHAAEFRAQAKSAASAEQARTLLGTAEQLEMSADELEQPVRH